MENMQAHSRPETHPDVADGSGRQGRKALILGGTGAMGVYLVRELAAMGYDVRVVSLDEIVSDHQKISYIQADAKDMATLKELLNKTYDVIVDFMIYVREQFQERYEFLLSNTAHYIFLSSYRVYGGDFPINESTPRLLDVSTDSDFLSTEDYALYKARQEDVLLNSACGNWTIVRPAVTYSKYRYQLVTWEAPIVVARAMRGLPVVLPEDALSVHGTMTWAGDVAKMISRLVLNPDAYRECFTLATAEHHTWGEIADYYKEIIGLKVVPVATEDYLKIMGGSDSSRYQLAYDRLFTRIIDNSKTLEVTGLKQAELMPLRDGLKKELSTLPKDMVWPDATAVFEKMDAYLKGRDIDHS